MVRDPITKRTIQGRYLMRPPPAGKLNEFLVARRSAVPEPRRNGRGW